MRLTKRKAVEITKELWEWVGNSRQPKYEWPRWNEYGRMWNDCPLCEYGGRHATSDESPCLKCPLLGMWTEDCDSTCTYSSSPYRYYSGNISYDKAAICIVALCDQWLKENTK